MMKTSPENSRKIDFVKSDRNWRYALCILFVLLLFPIIWIGRYNAISADDYAYGVEVYHAWTKEHSIVKAVKTAFEVVGGRYENWQGTYSSVFFMSLNPLNFHSGAGCITPLLMLGMLCSSSVFFVRQVIKKVAGVEKQIKRTGNLVAMLYLVAFIQCIDSPVEGFFWYNGAVHYMLMHSLMLFFLGSLMMEKEACTRKQAFLFRMVQTLALCITGFLTGGGNYISALQCVELGVVFLTAEIFLKKIKIPQLLGMASLLSGFFISVTAPGNSVRQAASSGMGMLSSVINAFLLAAKDVKEWMNPLILIVAFLLIPSFCILLKNMKYRFQYPIVVTILCFCLYSSLYSPGLYGVGNVDSGRMRNVIQASFYLYLMVAEFYWLGYFYRKVNAEKSEWTTDLLTVVQIGKKYLWLYKTVLLLLFVGVIVLTGDKNTYTSMSAFRSLILGEAQTYYEESEERREIYLDSNVRVAEVEPYSVRPYVLFFTDIVSEDNANYWINENIAAYYQKEKVLLKCADGEEMEK